MALVGDLSEINIASVVQLNCIERNTSQLTVSTRKGPATIYFSNGEIVEATFSGETGQEALYRILGLAEGEFRVTPVSELPERTIFTSWQNLLLEGMRVIDETEKGRAEIAESIGKELEDAPEVECYAIASKNGDVIVTNGTSDSERLAAAAALVAWKGQDVASRMALGEMRFSTLVSGNAPTFFMHCGGLVAVVVGKKSAVRERLHSLVNDIREKLKPPALRRAQREAEMWR
jgi:predicted regulator of Ras-like GTPase activity (Roadblock/LC7/MglB family)